jgi:branched-chain amino acid transport system permease protein
MTTTVLAGAFSAQVNLLLPLIGGLTQGAAYGLIGLGLVLLYKSNRIFNFAQGEFATVGALTAFLLNTGYSWLPKLPYPIAILAGVSASVLVAMATERLVIRPLFDRPRVVLVVATVGVALALIGVEGFIFPRGGSLRSISDVLGLSPSLVKVDRVPVAWQDALSLLMLVALAVAALLFFRRTATGSAILAVSQDSTAARVVGIPVERISLATWGLAGLLGGIAGVLLAVPPGGVAPGIFTGLTLRSAFAAAVLGGMTSLSGAFVGGLAIGLVEAFASNDFPLFPGLSTVPAAGEVAVAVVLLLVLLVRPRGLFGKEA